MSGTTHTVKAARRRSRSRLVCLSLAVSAATAAIFPQLARADKNVQVQSVAHGSASLASIGRNTTITVSNGAIVNYSMFNIPAGSSVTFIEPTAQSRVLNRINSSTPSFINGALSANGIVYFVDPAGITFGANSVINVGGLYAAAGNITNSDFLNHVDRFTASGALINQGQIVAGNVVLTGTSIINSGSITADKGLVLMTTGSGVYLGESGEPIYVQVNPPAAANASASKQSAPAQQQPVNSAPAPSTGVGDMYWTALTSTGTVRASNITLAGGASAVNVSGKLDASGPTGGNVTVTGAAVNLSNASVNASGPNGGGTVQIGGGAHGSGSLPQANSVTLDSGTIIDADATLIGNGGTIVIWSDGRTISSAALSARGGPTGGNGGFIETSGQFLQVASAPNASAPLGLAGTWLLDPQDIEIISGANNGILTGSATVTNGTIEAALNAGTNVEVTTNQAGPDSGVLTQDANATINAAPASGDELTLQANSTMDLNGGIVQTGGSNLTVELDELGNSTITVNAAISVTGPVTILGGNLQLTSNGSISAASVAINNSTMAGDGSTVTPGSTNLQGSVFTAGGSVLIGGTGLTTGGSGTIMTSGGNVDINTSGDIVIGAAVNTDSGEFSAIGNSFENDAEISDGGDGSTGNAFTVDTTASTGSISINGEISWTGGTGREVLIQGNGPISLTSNGEIVSSSATQLPVEIDNLDATGQITLNGTVNTSGTYTSEGGNFLLGSTGSLTALAAAINTSTSTSNSLTVTPGTTTLNGPAVTNGEDFDAAGTSFTSNAAGTIMTSGGAAIIAPSGGVTIAGVINTSGTSGSSGGNGGTISISGTGTLNLSVNLTADGGAGSSGNGGNGGAITISGFTTNSLTGGIVIDASGGNSVGGSTAGSGGDITVDFGTGDTNINLGSETFKSAGGSGGTAGSGGQLFFNGSNAATTYDIPAFNAASATVTGGSANDTADITGLGPANLTVNLGGGNNTFEFSLALLGGAPTITLAGTSGGTLILDGTAGNDVFTVTSTAVSLGAGGSYTYGGQLFSNLIIQGLGGNDSFTVNSTSTTTTIYAGTQSSSLAGDDTFIVNGVGSSLLSLFGDSGTNTYEINYSPAIGSDIFLQSTASVPTVGNGTDYLALSGTGNVTIANSGPDIVASDSSAPGALTDFASIMPHLAGIQISSTAAASGSTGAIAINNAIDIPGAGNGSAVNGISPGISINGNLGAPPAASTITFTSPGALNAGNSPIVILAGSNITLQPVTTTAADNGAVSAVTVTSISGNILDGTGGGGVDITDSSGSATLTAGGSIGDGPVITSLLAINASGVTGVNLKNTDPGPSNSSLIQLTSTSGSVTLNDTGNPTVSFESGANATISASGTLTFGSGASGAVSLGSSSTAAGAVAASAADINVNQPISGNTVALTALDSGSAIVVNTGGSISGTGLVALTAPDVDIVPAGATTVSSSTEVDLIPLISSPSSTPLPVELGTGSASGVFTMTASELNAITSPLLRIGTVTNSAASIEVLTAINFLHVPTVHMYSSGNITTPDATSATPVDLIEVVGGAGSLALSSSAGLISVGTQVADISASAAGSIFIYDSSNLAVSTVDSLAGVTSANSTVTIDLPAGSTLSNSSPITALSGNISLAADSMDLDATIDAGGHLVTIEPVTAGRQIGLGFRVPPNSLDPDLTQVTAGALLVGSPASGTIMVGTTVTLANVQLVQLESGGSITNEGSNVANFGFATSGSLALNSASSVDLALTNVTQLAVAANGTVNLSNTGAGTTITTLSFTSFGLTGDTLSGITSGGNAITVSSPSLINDSTISAETGNISLAADTLSLANGSLMSGTGTLTIQTLSANQLINLGSAAGAGAGIQISQANFNDNLSQNFQSIAIEQAAGSHDASHVITVGTLTLAEPLIVGSNTPVAGAHDIDITGPVTDSAGIVFSGSVDVPVAADGITVTAGTSAVSFLGNIGVNQAPASLSVTAGQIIFGGSAGASIQVDSSGPMTFNGPVTTGGASFAMTAGGNVTFGGNITSSGGNVAVNSAGNITVDNVVSDGTIANPNAGNITLQPGATENLIFDPSPEVAVTTINISAQGNGGTNGSISLEPAGYSTIPTAATIYAAYDGNGGTSNVNITGGNITFGQASKTTIIGNLTINGSGTVTLSDITVLSQLNVSGSPIVIQTHASGTQILNNQGQLVAVPGGFGGVGFVAGSGITFGSAPSAAGAFPAPEFATPGASNISPNLTKFVIRSYPEAITIPLLEFERDGTFTILTLSPAGTTTTDFASVIAGAVPRTIPQASDDIAVSPTQQLELAEIGIDARPLSTEQVVDFWIGRSLYNDLPSDVTDTERFITPNRLYSQAVQDLLSTYDEVFFTQTTDEHGKLVHQSQYEHIRDLFARAQQSFMESHRTMALTPENFRLFILSDPSQAELAEKMAQIANFLHKLGGIGLNSAEYMKSRDVVLNHVAPPGASAQFMYSVIMGPGQ